MTMVTVPSEIDMARSIRQLPASQHPCLIEFVRISLIRMPQGIAWSMDRWIGSSLVETWMSFGDFEDRAG